MDLSVKNETMIEKHLKWFDKNFSKAYSRMSSSDFVSKILGFIHGSVIFYLYFNYIFLIFALPGMLCSFVFEVDGENGYFFKTIFAIILFYVIWIAYRKYYLPEKERVLQSNCMTLEDKNLLIKIQIFFGINAFVGLIAGWNGFSGDFTGYAILAVMLLDFITILYLAKAIKSFFLFAVFFALWTLLSAIGAVEAARMSGMLLTLYAICVLFKNFKKFMYIISQHKTFLQWVILSAPIIFGIFFCIVGAKQFAFSFVGCALIFIGYYIIEYFIMSNYRDSLSVKVFLEHFCSVPVIFFTLCIALASIYNRMEENNLDDKLVYNDNNEFNDEISNEEVTYDGTDNIYNDTSYDSYYTKINNQYAGAIFPNGFEAPAITGLGAFSAGNTLDFGGATINTTIDIPEFHSNPYMLFTTHSNVGNFNIADANGMTQISVVDGNVYDATHTLVGGLKHDDVTGITTLNSNSNEVVMSWDQQNNIYAGTPETGHLVGRVDKGVGANTLRDMSGGIVSYTDALGNAYGANGTPLGSVRKI